MIEERSAGIVLFRESDDEILFLLLHYPTGHWDFVKGKIEKDESAQITAIRETKEETGITDVEFIEGFQENKGVMLNDDLIMVRNRLKSLKSLKISLKDAVKVVSQEFNLQKKEIYQKALKIWDN